MLLRTEHIPPRPESIPSPCDGRSIKFVKLADLPTRQYVGVIARVVSLRVREVCDKLGSKRVLSGILEDVTFKVPYVCHKTTLPVEKDSILEISSAYVHEFDDSSLLLVLTEHTEAKLRASEDSSSYFWLPKIGKIRRPVWNVVLHGIISNVFNSSGLVKRCNNCRAIVYDSCPNGCDANWEWDLRISALLQDDSGSIKMILGRYLSSKILERNLGEVFHIARTKRIEFQDDLNAVTCNMILPESLSVMEALVEDPSSYRRHGKLIVSDGVMRINFLKGEEVGGSIIDANERTLDTRADQDRKLLRRIVEKAIEIRLDGMIGRPRTQGIYLLEDPIPLYYCERAKLQVGFTTNVTVEDERVMVEAFPQTRIQESVSEYVRWRRERGATAEAIERALLNHRASVVTAPYGHPGRIEGLIYKKAGEERISELDGRDFTRFWEETYDMQVAPDETPLVRVKLLNLDLTLTYPPSCVYFEDSTFHLKEGVRRFIEAKRSSAKWRVQGIMREALHGIKVGETELKPVDEGDQWIDTKRFILHDIRERLLRTSIRARGSVCWMNGQPYFFPSDIAKIS